MSLVERWNHVESGLEPGWTEATLSLEIQAAQARSRAAALLGPAGPGLSGNAIRFTVSTRRGVGPDGVRRLLRRIDEEGTPGRLELVTSASMPHAAPATRRTLVDAWDAALDVLPADWSDLLVELELDSSADIDRGAVLCAPLNPIQTWPEASPAKPPTPSGSSRTPAASGGGRPGFRFRCASRRGYGASAGMVGRCLGRLDDDGITGAVRITRVLSDVHPVATQGAVFGIGRRPA